MESTFWCNHAKLVYDALFKVENVKIYGKPFLCFACYGIVSFGNPW